MTEQPQPQMNPTSWRDVYTLVQDVERRLTERMDDLVKPLYTAVADHEHRVRIIEATGTPLAQGAQAIANANAIRITALEAANVVRQAQRQGQTQFITYGQKVIMTVVVVVNVALALIALIRP